MRTIILALVFAVGLLGTACASKDAATPASCTTLAKRCTTCPPGDLKRSCESAAATNNADTCSSQLKAPELEVCDDGTSNPDGGSSGSVVTDPCPLLAPQCGKCKDAALKTACEDLVRAGEPGNCRALLADAKFAECQK
jgi:hypothetical protein